MSQGPSEQQEQVDGRVARAGRLREERRTQILAACRHVFAERGYHRASIKDILDAAGIARGTFYAHFDSKQAALEDILTEFLGRLRDAIRPVDVDPDDDSLDTERRQLGSNVMRALALFEEDDDLARLVLHQATGLSPELDAKLASFYDGVAALIQRSLNTGHSLGIVREGDRELWARFILGALKEVAGARLQAGRSVDGPGLAPAILDFVLPAVTRRITKKRSLEGDS